MEGGWSIDPYLCCGLAVSNSWPFLSLGSPGPKEECHPLKRLAFSLGRSKAFLMSFPFALGDNSALIIFIVIDRLLVMLFHFGYRCINILPSKIMAKDSGLCYIGTMRKVVIECCKWQLSSNS